MGRSRDLADGTLAELNVDSNTLAVDATNNRVGIGTASPSTNLHVSRGSAGGGSWNGYTALAVESPNYAVISLKSPNANFSQILFADLAGTSNGQIAYMNSAQTNANSMQFYTNNTERMRIDSSGRVTMPYQPSFRAFKTSSWSTGNSVITGWSTFHNTGNHLNTSTGVFTAPVAGVYQVSFHWLSDNTTTQSDVHIRLNNAPNNGIRTRSASSGGHQTTSGSQSIYMSANDTLNFFFESGDKVYMDASQTWTSWSVTLLG